MIYANDNEIWDDASFYDDLLKKEENRQCYSCGGWHLFCHCKNMDMEVKANLKRYCELLEENGEI